MDHNDPEVTPEQARSAQTLQHQVGSAPERLRIDRKYGILRLDYCASGRHFFIDRDGHRLFWLEVP